MSDELRCLNDGDPLSECSGPVEYRWPGYGDKSWPRCEFHGEQRLETQRGIDERYPVTAPPDFDPMDAGEVWGEDDY